MKKLRRIGVLSLSKLIAVLMGIVGLVFAILAITFATVFGGMFWPAQMDSYGIALIVVLPILYAVTGYVSGAIFAFLYNLVAGWVGGVEIDIEK